MAATTIDDFLERVRKASEKVLMLDYDGTLSPFTADRDRAKPYDGVREVLDSIVAARGRIVIISGRPARQVEDLLGLKNSLEVWGSHGAERLYPDGAYAVLELDATDSAALDEAIKWARDRGYGDFIEVKPVGAAIHWRGMEAEKAGEVRDKAMKKWEEIAAPGNLEIREFDGGIELRHMGINKGEAVRIVLDGVGEDSAVAYLGDDLTDEDAFSVIKSRGLGVLVRPEHRKTAADMWLKPPEELLEFLSAWLDACEAGKNE